VGGDSRRRLLLTLQCAQLGLGLLLPLCGPGPDGNGRAFRARQMGRLAGQLVELCFCPCQPCAAAAAAAARFGWLRLPLSNLRNRSSRSQGA
jgi:hypothetical protein